MLKCSCGGEIEFDEYNGHYYCQKCGEYVEVQECPRCGELKVKDGIDVCDDCIDECTNGELVYKFGEFLKEPYGINHFLLSCFSPSEIENILLKIVTSDDFDLQGAMNAYIREFKLEFASWLKKRSNEK